MASTCRNCHEQTFAGDYCSSDCYDEYQSVLAEGHYVCETCGGPCDERFCSSGCAQEGRNQKEAAQLASGQPLRNDNKFYEKTCAACGCHFATYDINSEYPYCSQACEHADAF